MKTGPVKCSECAFGLESPTLDCLVVPTEAKHRSLLVVDRRWKADSEGCEDFMPLADLEKVASFAQKRGDQQALAEVAELKRRRL